MFQTNYWFKEFFLEGVKVVANQYTLKKDIWKQYFFLSVGSIEIFEINSKNIFKNTIWLLYLNVFVCIFKNFKDTKPVYTKAHVKLDNILFRFSCLNLKVSYNQNQHLIPIKP